MLYLRAKFRDVAQELQIDLSLPFEEIVRKKIEYHQAQLDWHQSQLDMLRHSISGKAKEKISSASQRVVKPYVYSILREFEGRGLTTKEIYNILDSRYNLEVDVKTKWIIAISVSLNSLVTFNKATSELIDGKGRNKKYFLKIRPPRTNILQDDNH